MRSVPSGGGRGSSGFERIVDAFLLQPGERCIRGVLTFCAEIGRGEVGASGGSGPLNTNRQGSRRPIAPRSPDAR